MQLKTIDRATIRELDKKILAALEAVGKEYGVDIRIPGGNYSATSYTAKVQISLKGQGGIVETPERRAFIQLCSYYGLTPADLGKRFVFRGVQFELTGLNAGAPKYVVAAKRVYDGKSFKFTRDVLSTLMAKPAVAA
jgi:hypothetical protein